MKNFGERQKYLKGNRKLFVQSINSRKVVARGWDGEKKEEVVGQRVETFSYKMCKV